MIDLNTGAAALLVNQFRKFIKAREKAVVIDTDLTGAVGAEREIDIRVFHVDETDAASCPQVIIIQMQHTQLAVRFGVVGPHRRHDNPVLERHPLDGKRFKNLRVIFFHIDIIPPAFGVFLPYFPLTKILQNFIKISQKS